MTQISITFRRKRYGGRWGRASGLAWGGVGGGGSRVLLGEEDWGLDVHVDEGLEPLQLSKTSRFDIVGGSSPVVVSLAKGTQSVGGSSPVVVLLSLICVFFSMNSFFERHVWPFCTSFRRGADLSKC